MTVIEFKTKPKAKLQKPETLDIMSLNSKISFMAELVETIEHCDQEGNIDKLKNGYTFKTTAKSGRKFTFTIKLEE